MYCYYEPNSKKKEVCNSNAFFCLFLFTSKLFTGCTEYSLFKAAVTNSPPLVPFNLSFGEYFFYFYLIMCILIRVN